MFKLKKLGATDIKVSPIGLGTVKFGRNQQVKYPRSFTIPNDNEVKQLLSLAKDFNVNLLDTAPAYGNSEERLGKLLAGQRQDWVISTKVGEEFIISEKSVKGIFNGTSNFNFTPKHINFSIERSLQRLATDYLDIVLVHSSGEDLEIIEKYEVFVTLETLKKRGLIRAYGMSTKTVDGGISTIEYADLAMVTYNPTAQAEKSVLDKAVELNKGILIKKALASGNLDKLCNKNDLDKINNTSAVQFSLEFIYQHPAVSSVIIGTINPEHLTQNLQCASAVL